MGGSYDAISQLISFRRGTIVDKQYQFDLLGNRVKVLENGIATNYVSNNVNAYTNITGGLSFTPHYDDNGNLLNDDSHTYAYDWNNKQVGVDDGAVTVKYDALGRRIAKNATTYYYIGDQMVEEYTDGQLSASYLYGNDIDEALQMKRSSSVYYYHTNHLGSTMALSDANGAIVERVDYDAYGQPTFSDADGNVLAQSSIGNAILFTGREYDYCYNGYYYRTRIYNSNTGRFSQKDPLLYANGLNDYNYTLNNPVYFKDPIGTTVIFVNGYDFFNKNNSSPKYWQGLDCEMMKQLNDYNGLYLDGSQKSLAHNLFPKNRFADGYRDGLNLSLNPNEPIFIVTHSMGGAYGKGLVQALLERGYNIRHEYDFAPYQPSSQQALVPTSQYAHSNDEVVGNVFSSHNQINGAGNYHITYAPVHKTFTDNFVNISAHEIKSFKYEIENIHNFSTSMPSYHPTEPTPEQWNNFQNTLYFYSR